MNSTLTDDKEKLHHASQLISKHKDLKNLPKMQRRFVKEYIKNEITNGNKHNYEVYQKVSKANKNTALQQQWHILRKPEVKNIVNDVRMEILSNYGYTQFCDKITDLAHNSNEEKTQLNACNSMLKVMGLHQQDKKQVNLNINLSGKDVERFGNYFS